LIASNGISSRTAEPGNPPGNAASSSSTGDRFALGASFALDPRTHAYRTDIADIALAGQIIAPHYARPLLRACGMLATFLRARPDGDSTPVSELLPGELFAVLEYAGGWAWGYCVGDHRVGYVEAIELSFPAEPSHVVCEASAPIHLDGTVAAPELARLPMGARLHGVERGSCLATEAGCIPLCYTRRIGEHDEDPVEVAERLIGAPFAQGGRTWRGLDCAGLVQLAFALCGYPMPRETDQQRQLGEPVPEGGKLRRGDLLFSGKHVALAVDDARVIHVSFAARAVKVEPVAAAREGDLPLTVRRLRRA
jgi:hypothetical protein